MLRKIWKLNVAENFAPKENPVVWVQSVYVWGGGGVVGPGPTLLTLLEQKVVRTKSCIVIILQEQI